MSFVTGQKKLLPHPVLAKMSQLSANASSSDAGTFPPREIITGLDRLRKRLDAVNDGNASRDQKLRKYLECCIPYQYLHSDTVTASGSVSAKSLKLTRVLRGAARLAGELGDGNQLSHNETNRRVLCQALASHIPAEFFDVPQSNILDQLMFGAIKFFIARGLSPTPESAHSLPSVPPYLQDCLPRGPGPRVTLPARPPVSSQDAETKASLKQVNPSTESDGGHTDALKTSGNQSLHLPTISTSSGQRTLGTDFAENPALVSSHGSLIAPQPETPKRQKIKKEPSSSGKTKSHLEIAETEDPTADEQSKKKKRKEREGEEPQKRKDEKRSKQKHHNADSDASEASVAASVALARKGKASEKVGRPAPVQKSATYDYNQGAVLVPDPMVEDRKQEAANAKRRAEERRLNPGARSGSPVFSSNVFEGTFRPRHAFSSSSKAPSGSKTNPTLIDSDPASGPERVTFRGLEAVPTGPRAITKTAPIPTRPKPSIDPATQEKKGKVFTVDVVKRMWQKEVDKVTFLNALLDAAGIDPTQRDLIEIRVLELGDSVLNAYRAVCFERESKRERREARL